MSGIAKDMDTYTLRIPIGVTAGITPFNFPAMIPLWVGLPNCSTFTSVRIRSYPGLKMAISILLQYTIIFMSFHCCLCLDKFSIKCW